MAKTRFMDINKNMYSEYIATLFANTIATISPKITIDNKTIQKEFNEFAKDNNLININYNLVFKLSHNGYAGLFLTNLFKKPKVVVADINTIDFDARGLIKNFNIDFKINELMTIINCVYLKSKYKYTFNYLLLSKQKEVSQLFNNIPLKIFLNNPNGHNDLKNVCSKWIDDYNQTLDIILSDSKTSKSLFHLNTPLTQASTKNVDELKKTIDDPSSVIFENNNIFSLLQSGGLQIQQGNSIFQSLLEKLKFYDNKIKELSFAPRSTLDAGTKNMHSDEINSINSQSDDYIELKANLLEQNWKEFIIDIYFDYLKNNVDKYKNFNFENINVEVEIAGSTKYLKNRSNEYIQNQNGSLINPNDINKAETIDIKENKDIVNEEGEK